MNKYIYSTSTCGGCAFALLAPCSLRDALLPACDSIRAAYDALVCAPPQIDKYERVSSALVLLEHRTPQKGHRAERLRQPLAREFL